MSKATPQYQEHLMRIRNAKSRVDSQAPVVKTKKDVSRMHLSYMEMLTALYRRNSRTFTKLPEVELQARSRGRKAIADSKATGDNAERSPHDIPAHVLKRYEKIMLSLDQKMVNKLLRPRIFMELEVKNVRPLGRISIQLYTEACPAIVLEFIRACAEKQNKNFIISRIIQPVWIEGTLQLPNESILNVPNMEVDMNAVDHGMGAGVLSFPSRYVRGNAKDFLTFSISLEPLSVLNGKRVAFGKIRRGNWILNEIQGYATNCGKPSKEIIVSRCGVL